MLLPTDPSKKRNTLQLISKIAKVVEFVQGITSDADVKKDITFAWSRCKESLCSILGHWPFHGSVRYAYDQRNQLKKSLGLALFDSCRQRLVCVQPPKLRQSEITNFYDNKGQLLTVDEDAYTDIPFLVDEDADTDVPFLADAAVPPAECLECPICPQKMGGSGDLVVFRNSDSLWQHWKTRHANDVRPALFKIHRVQGMKLQSKRNASWIRVPHAMSYHHPDYTMLKMREDIVEGHIKLQPGMLIEIEPRSESKHAGERWFAAVRDGRVMGGDRITAQFCHTNCLELTNEDPQKLTVASILQLGPFKDVPLLRRQLQGSPSAASRNELNSPGTPSKGVVLIHQMLPPPISSRKKKNTPGPSQALNAAPSPKNHLQTAKSEVNPSQHNQEVQRIESKIKSSTESSQSALDEFTRANARLHATNWSRCQTPEGAGMFGPRNECANLYHIEYTVRHMPRDGNCLFHCFLHILTSAGALVPKTQKILRKEMHDWALGSLPGSRYGGFLTSDCGEIPLEDSLLTNYGGHPAIQVFVHMYNVTIRLHAPESSINIETFKAATATAQEFDVLHTMGWENWFQEEEKEDEKEKEYKRSWGGDHWQIIETKQITNLASGASAATTVLKPRQVSNQKLPAKKLEFNNCIAAQPYFEKRLLSSPNTSLEQKNTPGPSKHVPLMNHIPNPFDILSATSRPQRGAMVALQQPSPNLCGSATEVGPSYTTGLHSHATNPINAGEKTFAERTEVQLMLRAVKTHPYMCNPKTNAKNPDDNLQLITIDSDDFFVYDFENHFDRVYPSHVRKILHAFPDLNEDKRSFFLALGIGTGMDPFTLQCLFRNEGERIMRGCEKHTKCIQSLVQPGLHVDFEVLRWCCPPDLHQFSVMILDNTQNIGPWLFETHGAHEQRKMVILMHDKKHDLYQLLRPHTGNESKLRQRATKVQVQTKDNMRCPIMSTSSQFKVFQNESVFLAAALQGIEPPQNELDAIWQQSVEEHGLKFHPVTEGWTEFPGWAAHLAASKKERDNEKDGSMVQSSWKVLRTNLLQAFETDTAHVGPECMFVDAGSESGRGLYHMIGDKRVTHVAGIEFQLAWFQLSQKIFNSVREVFEARGYRMPEVTLIHSCMIAQKPVIKWIYSSASIMWMNNFVYDKYVYFNSTDKNSDKFIGKSLLKKNKYLTPNAAYNFSLNFEDTTLIAVHFPEAFLEQWNYNKCDEFQVSCTWSQTSTTEKVTILRHTQHGLKISTNYTLPSPTMAALYTWDSWTKRWSDIASAGSQPAGPSIEYPLEIIAWRDLSTLTHRNWLSTPAILGYITNLRKQFPNMTFDQYMDPGSKTKKQLHKQFRSGKTNTNVFFFNIHESHWLGVKLEQSKKRILVYDSYAGDHETQFEHIEEIATRLGVDGPFERIEMKVPHQRNATDCGVTTCLFMLCMAQNIDEELMYDSPTMSRQFRLTLFADIVNQTVTVLKKKVD